MNTIVLRVVAALAIVALAGCARGPLTEQEILYAPVGASDVVGLGAIPLSRGYVFRIEEALEAQGRDVDLIPLAIPVADTRRVNRVVRVFLRTRAEPGLVTIWLGSNDLIQGIPPEEFEAELERVVSSLRNQTDAFIAIGNIPDLPSLPRFVENPEPTVTDERVSEYNAVIAGIADAHNVPVVDFFAAPVEDELVSDIDGFHPSNEGHQRVAEMFLEVILPEL